MTLRDGLGGTVKDLFDQVKTLLDSEDALIVLFDGRRMVSYTHGFAASPSQLELLGVEIEGSVRGAIGGQSTHRGPGGTVRKATKSEIAANVLAFIGIFVVLTLGVTAVRLTSEVRVSGMVMLPTAIVAGMLVMYFDWRAKLRSRILANRDDHREAA